MTDQEAKLTALIDRRTTLALQNEIPDFAKYAEEWNKLAADFRALGALHNAAICDANWKRYKPNTGEWIRLNYENYSELISTAPSGQEVAG